MIRDKIDVSLAALVARLVRVFSDRDRSIFWSSGKRFPTCRLFQAYNSLVKNPNFKNDRKILLTGAAEDCGSFLCEEATAEGQIMRYPYEKYGSALFLQSVFLAARKNSFLGRVVVDAVMANLLFEQASAFLPGARPGMNVSILKLVGTFTQTSHSQEPSTT